MPELSAQLPAIIGEAAKSPLGIFALMIISLAILGFFFFKEAAEKTRIAIFVMLFVGVAVFGLSIVRTTSAAAPASDGSGTPPAESTNAVEGSSAAEAAPARTTASEGTKPSAAAAPAEDALVKSILGTWAADVIYFRPRSFRETFTFELFVGRLVVTPTFGGSKRAAINVRTGDGAVEFDIRRQEIAGEVTTDIVSSYIGEVHPDRIVFRLSHDNGDPTVTFEARRAESK
jgi:hypothetical protein